MEPTGTTTTTTTTTSTTTTTTAAPTDDPGSRPVGPFTRRVMNPIITRLLRLGVRLGGAQLLTVPGRRSGEPRVTVINVLEHPNGSQYLLAPRGRTDWVLNLRASGSLELGRGHRRFDAIELLPGTDGDEMVEVLRSYLRRWGWQVRPLLDGARADDTDDELRGLLARVPIFRLSQQA